MREFINILEDAELPSKVTVASLPYHADALAPVISRKNLDFHYGTLYKNYVKKFNKGVDPDYNGAGAFLHELFFAQLQNPVPSNRPRGEIADLINDGFGTFKQFTKDFTEQALALQGSGWCYLSQTGDIKIIQNHAVEMDILLIVDLWEHSYYLDYGPDKERYLKEIWQLINWDAINERL